MQEMLFTVKQVSEILHCNPAYVYQLINHKLLPALKLGSYKVRKTALEEFLKNYEGYDLTKPNNVKKLAIANRNDNVINYVAKEVV